jgi:hypothetical protein
MDTSNSLLISLFEGESVRLAAPVPEKDAEALARWSRDAAYGRLLDTKPARPWLARNVQEEMSRWDCLYIDILKSEWERQ